MRLCPETTSTARLCPSQTSSTTRLCPETTSTARLCPSQTSSTTRHCPSQTSFKACLCYDRAANLKEASNHACVHLKQTLKRACATTIALPILPCPIQKLITLEILI
ncbi:hypothetical protein PoB_006390500 [Plakobranchus ocellatus]|uniref:Uncharacterized protein n=1 Tax=Plakobranchus ocellatus TaxID=259542 RepID=A0AAV4D013_9GAST|nr:hypothetical protein PoB_006390500 [Plakobranchus ocellatus]